MDCLLCGYGSERKDDESENCCSNMNEITDNGRVVCSNCGVVKGYCLVQPNVFFYDNVHLIRKPSRYSLKYYVR